MNAYAFYKNGIIAHTCILSYNLFFELKLYIIFYSTFLNFKSPILAKSWCFQLFSLKMQGIKFWNDIYKISYHDKHL